MRIEDLLEWKWADIIPHLPELKESGTDIIQISPVQPCKADLEYQWYFLFQPFGFNKIGNCKGTKQDLYSLCNEADKLGLKISPNFVCNHMAGDNTHHIKPHQNVDSKLTSNPYFWKFSKQIDNWEDRYENVNYCNGMPALDLSNYDLQDIIIGFIKELRECGVSALRIDAAKHMKLPCEGSDFFIRVMEQFKDMVIYGETIFESENILREYQKNILTLNNLSDEAYRVDKSREIVFVESSDSFLDKTLGYTARLSEDEIMKNYTYLKRDFPNTIHYNRPYSNQFKYANK